ncbi:MAG: carbohydrate ABC transporter permease [Bacilli bacterium]|nr:carbohydrate ABC transporter permease [Bacilli bacterium]
MRYISNPAYQPKSRHKSAFSPRERIVFGNILKYFLYCLPVIFFAFPFVVLISRSFFSFNESVGYTEGLGLFPKDWTIESYIEAFSNEEIRNGFLNGFKNTMIVVACNVIGVPLTAFMAAYAFTKIKFKFRKVIFTVALGTIMIPGILLMIPVYQMFWKMGWTNTLLPITIPCFFGGGILNIFMIMQFIRSIPKEIDEAAILDGASLPTRMFKLTLPLIKPIIIYMMVTAFFGAWNDFSGPLMYIKSNASEAFTLNLYIYYEYLSESSYVTARPNVQMVFGVIMMIPMLIIFIFFQKQLINGLTFGAVKE